MSKDPEEKKAEEIEKKIDEVTEAAEESFPASDPPSFTPLHAGTPDPEDAEDEKKKEARRD